MRWELTGINDSKGEDKLLSKRVQQNDRAPGVNYQARENNIGLFCSCVGGIEVKKTA